MGDHVVGAAAKAKGFALAKPPKIDREINFSPRTKPRYHLIGRCGPAYLPFLGFSMFNTRIITCAPAVVGLLFIGRQAMADDGKNVTITNTPLPVTATTPLPVTIMGGTPVAFS